MYHASNSAEENLRSSRGLTKEIATIRLHMWKVKTN